MTSSHPGVRLYWHRNTLLPGHFCLCVPLAVYSGCVSYVNYVDVRFLATSNDRRSVCNLTPFLPKGVQSVPRTGTSIELKTGGFTTFLFKDNQIRFLRETIPSVSLLMWGIWDTCFCKQDESTETWTSLSRVVSVPDTLPFRRRDWPYTSWVEPSSLHL